MQAEHEPICPLCGGSAFQDVRGRTLEGCVQCGSLARTRSAWLLLTRCCNVSRSSRIAHFAPEKQIGSKLAALCGRNYEPYDLFPEKFPFMKVRTFDLCRDLPKLETGTYDVVLHNHVIEHVPCNYTMVLLGLHQLLRPGGFHVFSCPVQDGYTRGDLNPDMPEEARRKRFGQSDHLRRFGRADFDATLGMVLGLQSSYSLADHVPEADLLRANIPPARWTIESGTVFVVRKSAAPDLWPYAQHARPENRLERLRQLFRKVRA